MNKVIRFPHPNRPLSPEEHRLARIFAHKTKAPFTTTDLESVRALRQWIAHERLKQLNGSE